MAWPATAAATNDVISASQWNNLPIKIQEYTLTSDVETVRFTNFPAWFAHLLLGFSARASSASAFLYLRMNPQYTDNYDVQSLIATTTSASAGEAFTGPSATLSGLAGSDTEEGFWSAGWVLIPNYTTTGAKVALSQVHTPPSRVEIRSNHARAATAAALDTMELYTSGNFASGSTFTLYGLP